MNTKYGQISKASFDLYINRLISRVFKILPLKEEKCETLDEYVESLLRELSGNQEIILFLQENEEFLSLMGTLENLPSEEDMKIYRSDVFKCIAIIRKLHASADRGGL
jgi:hypothetical protein